MNAAVETKPRTWWAFSCSRCGYLIFTERGIGDEVVCPDCRELVTVECADRVELGEEPRERD